MYWKKTVRRWDKMHRINVIHILLVLQKVLDGVQVAWAEGILRSFRTTQRTNGRAKSVPTHETKVNDDSN